MSIDINKLNGVHLRSMRQDMGLTQEELANRLGVSQPTLSKIENGEKSLRLYELFAYADALEMSPEELYRGIVRQLSDTQRGDEGQ